MPPRRPSVARHERPAIDEAALVTACHADRLLAATRELGDARWTAFLAPLPDRLRDAPLDELPAVARRCRAAFGPKDSIREVAPPDLTELFLDSVDRLLRALARREVGG
ncbi:MAG TPA: hypothetical protein VEY67_10525 [Candidatus Dormibacteraeota bacterium]|nr:hypothetical protein [Candidatus Dormibacteraeota bacterium]